MGSRKSRGGVQGGDLPLVRVVVNLLRQMVLQAASLEKDRAPPDKSPPDLDGFRQWRLAAIACQLPDMGLPLAWDPRWGTEGRECCPAASTSGGTTDSPSLQEMLPGNDNLKLPLFLALAWFSRLGVFTT